MISQKKENRLRTCISCRAKKAKADLVRIGEGRGAYICKTDGCFQKALKTNALARSLKRSISYQEAEEYAKKEGFTYNNKKSSDSYHHGPC